MQAQPAWFAVLQVLTPLTVVPPQLAREQAGELELHEGGGGRLVVVVDVVSFVVVLVVVLGLDDAVLLEVGADDVSSRFRCHGAGLRGRHRCRRRMSCRGGGLRCRGAGRGSSDRRARLGGRSA